MKYDILLAGFGGQGILFAGKLLAYCALIDGKELSWLPSYGPEMRGGTCNCSVCISDEPIGSPLVLTPDLLIALNQPSYDKFIGSVRKGGMAFVDSTLVDTGYSVLLCACNPDGNRCKPAQGSKHHSVGQAAQGNRYVLR